MYSMLRGIATDVGFSRQACFFYKNANVYVGKGNAISKYTFFKQPTRKCFNSTLHHDTNNLNVKRLWKPFLFTILFTSGSISGAAIWQYETMRAHAITMLKKNNWIQTPQKKVGEWRNVINSWWRSLDDSEKVFYPICLLNIIVFGAFRVPAFQPAMIKYFCSNPAAHVLCWPMILSTFSHYNLVHLAVNMFVLHSFSPGAIGTLGKEQFVGMYLAGGVISSMGSYFHKALTKQPGFSLGASGAIMAVLGFMCSQYPESKLSIVFLPMVSFTAATGLKAVMALDIAGVAFGWKLFDHAAHLGGACWGIFWCYIGNSQIWSRREPLLQLWHSLRGSPK